MKIIILIILAVHGLIHLMGFVKAFNIAGIDKLTKPISKSSGMIWLLATGLFLVSVGLMLFHKEIWYIPAALAILLSQVLIFQSWTDAKYGTIANLIILVPVIVAGMNALPSSYINRYKTGVKERLVPVHDTSVICEADISQLPGPVKKYLHFAGAVGKPKVYNFRALFTGSMRQKPGGKWMKIKSQQYNFFDDLARLFYLKAGMFGVPFNGLHYYTGNHAVMLIRVANLYTMVDARGDKMDQGETVTMFNDMCLLAPATLISKNIQWREISPTMVEARFRNGSHTINATLFFNEKGALINFISNDRFLCSDGKTYLAYPWSTPVRAYKDSDGRKVPTYGEAVWHMPGGSFSYGRFDIGEISYNLSVFK